MCQLEWMLSGGTSDGTQQQLTLCILSISYGKNGCLPKFFFSFFSLSIAFVRYFLLPHIFFLLHVMHLNALRACTPLDHAFACVPQADVSMVTIHQENSYTSQPPFIYTIYRKFILSHRAYMHSTFELLINKPKKKGRKK